MKAKFLVGAFLLGAAPMVSLLEAKPAEALYFSKDKTRVTINSGTEQGASFKTFFNGYIDQQLTQGLSAEAIFTLAEDYNGGDEVKFNVSLKNTSDSSVFSNAQVSALGFDTNRDLKDVSANGSLIDEAKQNSNIAQSPGTGGKVDACFTAGNSCTSGGGGVNLGNSTTFLATLKFIDNMNYASFDLNKFSVSYQNIDYINGPKGLGGVGTGEVPTPALIPGLIGAGIAALRKRKQQVD